MKKGAIMGTKEKPRVETRQYRDGALCVVFDGQVLSTNIPPYSKTFMPGVFAVKNWSEHAELARKAADSGLFEDLGIVIPTGYVEAPVWRIVETQDRQARLRYGTEWDDTEDVTAEVDEEIAREKRRRMRA
jgi:hypothetical protein